MPGGFPSVLPADSAAATILGALNADPDGIISPALVEVIHDHLWQIENPGPDDWAIGLQLLQRPDYRSFVLWKTVPPEDDAPEGHYEALAAAARERMLRDIDYEDGAVTVFRRLPYATVQPYLEPLLARATLYQQSYHWLSVMGHLGLLGERGVAPLIALMEAPEREIDSANSRLQTATFTAMCRLAEPLSDALRDQMATVVAGGRLELRHREAEERAVAGLLGAGFTAPEIQEMVAGYRRPRDEAELGALITELAADRRGIDH